MQYVGGVVLARPTEAINRVEAEHQRPLREILIDMYIEKNMHSSEIAKVLHVYPQTIVRWCHKLNIPVKPRGGRIQYDHHLKKKMVDMYLQGKSLDEISNLIGCSQQTVRLAVIEYGENIRTKEESVLNRRNFDLTFFDKIDSPDKAYMLGFIAADGCVVDSKDTKATQIKISAKDIILLKWFANLIGFNLNFYHETRKSSKSFVLRLGSVHMVKSLSQYGIVPRKSLILKPYYGIREDLICHYIRGYFDGDGWVTFNKKYLKIGFCGSWFMINWINKQLKNHCNIKTNKISKHGNIYTIQYSGCKAIRIRDFIYPNKDVFGLPRKKEKLFSVFN